MIFVYHLNNKICQVQTQEESPIEFDATVSIAEGISQIAACYPNDKIVWCHWDCKEWLNFDNLEGVFHHNKLMLSFCPQSTNYFSSQIGYVEESLFINVNKKVTFPTWQMSSVVGMLHASVIIELKTKIPFDSNFDYYLNSVSKLCMPLGLWCYSEPNLLKIVDASVVSKASSYTLFKYVKQHYKWQWIFLLLFNVFLYERKLLLLPFLVSLLYRKRNTNNVNLEQIKVSSTRKQFGKTSIDVIIPTIGRKKYLYDVLQDLAKQAHLPVKVIIVEQNPLKESVSELDYITNEIWPFTIKHIFTHQAGACNARNLALAEVQSEWVFLADDDIRFENNFIGKTIEVIKETGVQAISIKCVTNKEKSIFNSIFQWGSFGSGCSFVARKAIEKCSFNRGYEFGYGEDADFGMQLRNQGVDVLYVPEPQILHLKAPIGGFRTKPVLKWQNETIQPKPSPTVMLYQITHQTKEQRLGYKTTLFLKYYSKQPIKNLLSYFINFRKQWNQSLYWANQLKKQS